MHPIHRCLRWAARRPTQHIVTTSEAGSNQLPGHREGSVPRCSDTAESLAARECSRWSNDVMGSLIRDDYTQRKLIVRKVLSSFRVGADPFRLGVAEV